jgi:flap endonuclease-1
MGIEERNKLINGSTYTRHKLSEFRNKKIVIDSLSIIHKYMRDMISDNINIIDSAGENINEIHIVFSLTLNFLRFGITPIFVFDGKPNIHKKETLIKRKLIFDKKKEELDFCVDKYEKLKLERQCYKPSRKKINWSIKFLKSIGIQVIEHEKFEADPICAKLSIDDEDVIGILSNDIDILLLGGNSLIKMQKLNSFQIDMFNKGDFISIVNKNFSKATFDNKLLDMNNIIEICTLLGNDYVNRFKINKRHLKFHEILNLYKNNDYKLTNIIDKLIDKSIDKSIYKSIDKPIYKSIDKLICKDDYDSLQKDKIMFSYYYFHINNFNISCEIDEINSLRNEILQINCHNILADIDYTTFKKIAKYFMSDHRIYFYYNFFRDMKKIIIKGSYGYYQMETYNIKSIFDSYNSTVDTGKIHSLDKFTRWS